MTIEYRTRIAGTQESERMQKTFEEAQAAFVAVERELIDWSRANPGKATPPEMKQRYYDAMGERDVIANKAKIERRERAEKASAAFAEVAIEIMGRDGLTYEAASKVARAERPELFHAWEEALRGGA